MGTEALDTAKEGSGLKRRIEIGSLGAIDKYHLRLTLLLSSVPLVCGVMLLMLLLVFAKLNLYYLESNGMILEEQVRGAYFKQVEFEIWGVVWYLMMQIALTFVASFVVMRWASAPFLSAIRTIRTALENPDQLKPSSRWLSESPAFDSIVWNFILQVRSGKLSQTPPIALPRFGVNALFLLKFLLTFIALSVITGYVMGIILSTVYERIVSMALHLVQNTKVMTHYFVAQQDILSDAVSLMTVLSLFVYFIMGWYISRYMTTMIAVFAKGLSDAKFPIILRRTDVYHELAELMNAAQKRIN